MSASDARPPGSLVIVGTPIGNLGDLSPRATEALRLATVIACEDTRRTGRLLSGIGVRGTRLIVTNEHTEARVSEHVVGLIASGESVALVSDAGMPIVSDPGAVLVAAVIAAGLTVEVVPGPSAVVTALALSGIIGDRFCFEGFLPRKGSARDRRIAALVTEQRTAVLFEAPHRVARTVADLTAALGSDRYLAICRELTKKFEETWRGSLGDAVEFLAAREPRGEFVLVLHGAAAPSDPTDEDIEAEVARSLRLGHSRRDAADEVARRLGVSRRRAYETAVRLGSGEDGPDQAEPEQPGS